VKRPVLCWEIAEIVDLKMQSPSDNLSKMFSDRPLEFLKPITSECGLDVEFAYIDLTFQAGALFHGFRLLPVGAIRIYGDDPQAGQWLLPDPLPGAANNRRLP